MDPDPHIHASDQWVRSQVTGLREGYVKILVAVLKKVLAIFWSGFKSGFGSGFKSGFETFVSDPQH
jgi:hypothetical protein